MIIFAEYNYQKKTTYPMGKTYKQKINSNRLKKLACCAAVVMSLTGASAKDIYSWQNVKIGGGGGFIPGIIYNESEKNLLYIRTDMGGMYRYDYATKKNIPLTDFVAPEDWNWLGAESFATDPVEPNICYLMAGTYTNDWTDHMAALYRSTDYGDSWTRYDMPFKSGGNMPGRSVGERLMIDPHDNTVLYFGARSGNGLWKSTDSGKTWNKIESFPVTGTYIQDPEYAYTADPIGIGWVAFDTQSSEMGAACKRLFVGAMQAEGDNIYESTDGGETWTAVAGQPTNAIYEASNSTEGVHIMPHHGVLRDSFLVLPYNDKCGPYDGGYGEVWKYNIYTKEWFDITPHMHEKDEAWGTDVLQTEDAYFGYGGCAVDAQNPNRIMVSVLNSYWPDAMLFFSEDGGASWYRSFYWTSYPSAVFHYDVNIGDFIWLNWGTTTSRFPDVVQPKLGWMIGDLEINPFNSEEMLYGTGATLYGTSNLSDFTDTTTTMHITSWGDGIEECAVLSLCVPPTGDVKVVTGVGDIGGFTHTDVDTPTQMWTTPVFSRGSSVDYAELDPVKVVRVGTCSPAQYEDTCNIASSGDGGLTWNKRYESCMKAKNGSVAISAKGNYTLWSTEDQGVWGGADYGMKQISAIPSGSYVCSDRVNDSVFYIYSEGQFMTFNTESGTITNTATHDSFPTSSIYIKAVPGFEGHVWLPCNKKGLFVTEDGGKTFSMPCADVDQCDVIGFGKAAEGKTYPTLYMTGAYKGKTGVYRSTDKGATWQRINDDEHQYGSINYAISGDMRTYGICYFGTNGRGVITGKIASTEPDDETGTESVAADNEVCPVGVYRQKDYVRLTDLPIGSVIKLYDATGKLVASKKAESDEEQIKIDNQIHILSVCHNGKTTSVKF